MIFGRDSFTIHLLSSIFQMHNDEFEILAAWMGWELKQEEGWETVAFLPNGDSVTASSLLKDWNLWRVLEEKVMKDVLLWHTFRKQHASMDFLREYMQADLPERCNALLSALDSLNPSPSE